MMRWISYRLDLNGFGDRRMIRTFALTFSLAAFVIQGLMLGAVLSMAAVVDPHMAIPWPLIVFGLSLCCIAAAMVFGLLGLVIGRAIHSLAVSRAEFERLSSIDMLSGLANRRAFTTALADASPDASLVIFDIDRFKSINDRYGHALGDAVIAEVSAIFAEAFDGDGFVARLGGEEFGAIIYGGTLEERMERLEDVLASIACREFAAGAVAMAVTVSAGVAEICTGRARDIVYSSADKALYLAKALGRNRVIHESDALHHVWFAMDHAGGADEAPYFAMTAR